MYIATNLHFPESGLQRAKQSNQKKTKQNRKKQNKTRKQSKQKAFAPSY